MPDQPVHIDLGSRHENPWCQHRCFGRADRLNNADLRRPAPPNHQPTLFRTGEIAHLVFDLIDHVVEPGDILEGEPPGAHRRTVAAVFFL